MSFPLGYSFLNYLFILFIYTDCACAAGVELGKGAIEWRRYGGVCAPGTDTDLCLGVGGGVKLRKSSHGPAGDGRV